MRWINVLSGYFKYYFIVLFYTYNNLLYKAENNKIGIHVNTLLDKYEDCVFLG